LRISEAAREAGISTGFLSAVERGQAVASVATIQRLAAAYGTPALELFEAPAQPGHRFRATGRQVRQAYPGVSVELLSPQSNRLESMLFRAAPGAGSAATYVHDGEEIIYVQSGAIHVWLDEQEHVTLGAGDSFWFESTRGHRWINPSPSETAVLVWVCSRG
jgi:quercetin dioxygenase-like cupin family protein